MANYALDMLAPKAQYSVGDAKRYFKEHLSAGDYYAEGQRVPGEWFGKGAENLGLSGVTNENDFVRLCENLHPQTGDRLTLRQKTTRSEIGPDGQQRQSANRRVFYDFTFSPPKPVSIAALGRDDSRIVRAHEQAVRAALNQLQFFAATRVRKNGQCSDRTTGNIVAAVFRHDTSRALDPHLHSHCIVFNATFDAMEGQWKALQNHDILVAQKFIENVYYHELARELRQFGYGIENKPRGDFEIKGISPELIDKLSKRHREIGEKTHELLEREPEKADGNIAAIREHIAHKQRPRKIKDVGLAELRNSWDSQLTPDERASLRNLPNERPSGSDSGTALAERAVSWAEEHLFDRRSVVHEHELWRHALERARGQNVSLEDLQSVTRRRAYVRDEAQPGKVTTREHLQREWSIVCMARDGRSQFEPFCSDCSVGSQLDAEQGQAVEGILHSRNLVTLFRGGAGTGKSFTLREVQRTLLEAGHVVQVIAPQRQQVLDLEKDGFQNVETVSAFLTRRDIPRGAVVLVDEAGQIGGKQMHALLDLIQANKGRVILSGDTRQHGAVEATDALRAIVKHSGLPAIELTNIRRQNPALAKSIAEQQRIKEYRKAVMEASDGQLLESFNRLDRLGAVVQCTLADQHEKLAERYLSLAKNHQSTVVVSQSWNEINRANEEIRTVLKRAKVIGEGDVPVAALQPVDLTNAQKRDARSYDENTVLVFNRNVRGFNAGESARFRALTDTHLIVEAEGRLSPIAFKHLDKVTVCQRKEMPLATGDRLQLKANGRSVENQKLANGELVTAKEVHEDGRIVLSDGRTLPPNFRQFVRGYAVTSYASQGKSVNHVLFSDSAVRAATNQQQWYVTISRGKKGVHIFTTDKNELRENVTRSGDRPLALELVRPKAGFARQSARIRRRNIARTLNIENSRRESARRRAGFVEQFQVGGQFTQQPKAVHPVNRTARTPTQAQNNGRGIGL
ncbi:MAG: relaxase domain-containing protein [Verrucomicrobia bacterium]|nr:relaxase domain-containing protein [Verrucomicrobiota bacterium]